MTSERVRDADVVIATDFGHGMIASSTIDALIATIRNSSPSTPRATAAISATIWSRKYPRADYICIDAPEARLATADKFSDIASVIEKQLHGRIDCDNIIVTHGSFGCYPFSAKTGVARVPAFTKTVVDTVGAGDAFLTITAPLVAAGGEIRMSWPLSETPPARSRSAIVGHRNSVEKVPLVKFITALLK